MKRLLLLLAAILLASNSRAALDLNSDGVPDVWANVHAVGAMSMSEDPDGDGQTSAQEALWGTNPMSPTAVTRITSLTTDEYGVHLAFPGQAGKEYRVQAAPGLSGPWGNVGSAIIGTDGELT